MSEDFSAQKHPTLTWNPARSVWEILGTESLLCEHLEPFSQTWPTSGMMRNGQVFELPMQAHLTTVSESSSLPTPTAVQGRNATSGRQPGSQHHTGTTLHDLVYDGSLKPITEDGLLRSPTASQGEGGALGEEVARKRGNTVGIRDQAMDIAKLNGEMVSRAERNLMPTPMSRDYKGDTAPHERDGKVQTDTVERAIFHSGEVLLGTPRTSTANGSTQRQVDAGAPKARLEDQVHTNWGRFEPAIRRWEQILGRPAPAPTKPDGKDGNHRLSSAFTEWMMGVPDGWITDVGLTRNEELKACGNGVVPQQAELALRMLLEGISLPDEGDYPMLPTATPSDAYIGNLASTQRKPGSMHSVNLAVAADGITKGAY